MYKKTAKTFCFITTCKARRLWHIYDGKI